MEKTRIVFFVDILQRHFDGVSNTIHQLASRLPKDQIEAIFITTYAPDDFDFPVYECPYFSFPLYKDYRVGTPGKMKELVGILEEFKPHLVHYTSPSLFGRYAIKYAHSRGIPVTSTYHTHFYSYMEYYFGFFKPLEWGMGKLALRLTRWFYKNTTKTFVPSAPMKEFLVSLGITESAIGFFRRGINTRDFSPNFRNPSFKQIYNCEGQKVVLFVSRLVKEKELDTLIRVYHRFQSERADVTFMITGDGPFKSYLEKHMPNAIFTGKRTKRELAEIYASSDIFIFPSITETFGNVVLEAIASGLPAVVAAAGGPQGIVERSGAGKVVQPKDDEAFFKEISGLIDNPTETENLQQKGVRYAQQENWEDICSAMATDLIKVADNH